MTTYNHLETFAADDLTCKLFSIDRIEIDQNDDGNVDQDCPAHAYSLIGIDSAGVRRVDITIDHAYDRWVARGSDYDRASELIKHSRLYRVQLQDLVNGKCTEISEAE